VTSRDVEHGIVADYRPERVVTVGFDAVDRTLSVERDDVASPGICVSPAAGIGEQVVHGVHLSAVVVADRLVPLLTVW
jgi:hypothetical protein